jgi:hypothetical protein
MIKNDGHELPIRGETVVKLRAGVEIGWGWTSRRMLLLAVTTEAVTSVLKWV